MTRPVRQGTEREKGVPCGTPSCLEQPRVSALQSGRALQNRQSILALGDLIPVRNGIQSVLPRIFGEVVDRLVVSILQGRRLRVQDIRLAFRVGEGKRHENPFQWSGESLSDCGEKVG